MRWRKLISTIVCTIVLVACTPFPPTRQPAPTTAATPIPLTPSPTAVTAKTLLPAPLYLIAQENNQILRIESDGKTVTQITAEAGPVIDFDVSPQDGHLVYVSENTAHGRCAAPRPPLPWTPALVAGGWRPRRYFADRWL